MREGEKVKAQTSLYLFLHVLNLNLLSANEKRKQNCGKKNLKDKESMSTVRCALYLSFHLLKVPDCSSLKLSHCSQLIQCDLGWKSFSSSRWTVLTYFWEARRARLAADFVIA